MSDADGRLCRCTVLSWRGAGLDRVTGRLMSPVRGYGTIINLTVSICLTQDFAYLRRLLKVHVFDSDRGVARNLLGGGDKTGGLGQWRI